MSFSIPLSPSLKHYVRKSLCIHSGLLLTVVLFSLVTGFFSKKQRQANILLVKSSVRVDVVAMPRMTLKELKNIEVDIRGVGEKKAVPDSSTPPVPQKSDGAEFKVEKKEIKFKDMLKKYSGRKRVEKAQKIVKNKHKAASSLNTLGSKKLKKLILAGNRLAKGNTLTGEGGAEIQGQFQEYASRFPDWVRPHWNLPGYLMNKNFQCRIRVFVSATGELIKVKVVDSSNEDEYDQKAIAAIENASPFPPPPDSIRARVIKGDIILGFPL